MKELQANWTSRLISYGPATLDCLDRNGSIPGAFMITDISKDGTVGWVTRGSALEVFSAGTGHRVAAWSFGAILKETSTVVTAVTEYYYENALRLLVATTTNGTQTGMISVFDVKTSQVLKAVELPYKVTALESVVGVGCDLPASHVLSEHLRTFCGVVAVGTHHGHIYLLDLNLDDDTDSSDEIRPNSVLFLDPRVKDVAGRRFNAISKRKHLCMELDEESHQRGYYYFRKPDSSVVQTQSAEDVCVSSLFYMRQTATLAVGFSFGCFQLWGLSVPVLEYTSRLSDLLAPITHFAYQEPENDPRNFVYIWAARGPLPMDSVDEHAASMSLFQLGYGKKVWYEGLGYVYEELQSVGPRFEHELTSTPCGITEDESLGSRIVSCYTIQDPHFMLPERNENDDSFDEGGFSPDLSLCVFVWEAAPSDPHARSRYYLALFDMNRWYHAQMPHTFRYSSLSNDNCSFLAFYALDAISEACTPDNIMMLHINHSSVARYHSCIIPPPEQHFYPTSLAFDAACITETGIVHSKFLGLQRQILVDLERGGPQVLLEPTQIYNLCLCAGLLPRTVDVSGSASVSIVEKRSAILNVALQHNLLSFITACIHTWASGEYTSIGCTLRFLLEWAWASVTNMKAAIDKICVSLYDWSGIQLDAASMALLHQHQVVLQHASSVLASLAAINTATTDQGQSDLQTKLAVVRLIENHVAAVVWCYAEGLLPEVSEEEMTTEGRYAYPQRALAGFYSQRRQHIERLNSEMRGTELLLIDGLVDQTGDTLHNLLEKEGSTALYPPSSLHAVLNMYLLDGIPLVAKHSIFYYLLCDLMYLTPEETTEKFEEKMHHFAQAFCLPYTTTRLVQGFWHLDHKQFEEAMYFLLDPMIRSELSQWQHTRIIKALLYQGHHKMALKYMRIKKPAMLTAEDVKLRLTVLLANGLTSEAFEYQRICRDQLNTEDLLSHLFLGCQQTRTMDQLLQLPMTADEERHLLQHMRSSTEPHSDEVLVLHYFQRSRIIEALHHNSRLKNSTLADVDTAARERTVARHAIVDCYQRVLPKAQRKMAFGAEPTVRRSGSTRREVARPVPLSMFVNRTKHAETVSHATLINTILNKVREVKEEAQDEPQPSTSHQETAAGQQLGPFIGTPVIPKARSRINETAEVVFPNLRQHMDVPSSVSPQKRPYPSPLSTSKMEEPFQTIDFTTKRMNRLSSAAALSLLQTPPVRRKTPTRLRSSAPPSASTPQSILKVRHQVRRSPSPTKKAPLTLADMCLPTPPRMHRRLNMSQSADQVSSVTSKTVVSVDGPVTSASTPKQLRFSVPASPNTASPEVGKDAASSSTLKNSLIFAQELMRSVRDRSPTPERMSPKASPNMEVVREGERRKVDEMMELGEEMEDIQEEGREEEEASDHEEMEVNQETTTELLVHRVWEEQDSDGLEDEAGGHMEQDYRGEESVRTLTQHSAAATSKTVTRPSLSRSQTVPLSAHEYTVCTRTRSDSRQPRPVPPQEFSGQENGEAALEKQQVEGTSREAGADDHKDVPIIEIQESDSDDGSSSTSSSKIGAVTRTESLVSSVSGGHTTRQSFHSSVISTTTSKVIGTLSVVDVVNESDSDGEEALHLRIDSDSENGGSVHDSSCHGEEVGDDMDSESEGMTLSDRTSISSQSSVRDRQKFIQQEELKQNPIEQLLTTESSDEAETPVRTSRDSEPRNEVSVTSRPELLKLSLSTPEFKTPPRPNRVSTMPPTPPESGQGTPPQESPPKGQVEQGIQTSLCSEDTPVSRAPKAKSPSRKSTASAVGKATAGTTPTTPTRLTRSRATVEDDVTLNTPEVEATTRSTPTRSKKTPSTPTRPKPAPRETTPPRVTRAKASSPARSLPDRADQPMETSVSTRSVLPQSGDTPETVQKGGTELISVRVTRARARTDSRSTMDGHEDESDIVSVASSTPSRKLRSRLGSHSTDSRSGSPENNDAESLSGQVTPPRTEEQEAEVNVRVTRSGGRTNTPTRTTPTRTPKVTTPTRSSRRKTDLNDATTKESGEGPLSSGSFMMGLRSRRSVSRDTTPESSRPSDLGSEVASEVSSVVTEEDINERTNFTFSEPMAVDISKGVLNEMAVPLQSFIFSPPLTRTRVRRSQSHTPTADVMPSTKVKALNILPDKPVDQASITKAALKRSKKSKSTSVEPSNSPVNLLSPPTEEELQEWAEGSSWQPATKGHGLNKRVMTLRPKKVSSKKKPPLKLW